MSETAVLSSRTRERFHALHRLVGNTPLLAIELLYRGEPRVIYAKQESLNLTGSIKDRMALVVLEQAYLAGTVAPGDRIAEATSGNTGISFAAIGRALGHPVTIFMPDWMSAERTALVASFGADIVPISRAEGGFLGSIARAEELAARQADVFLPRQFENADNVRAHADTTGPEIWMQLVSAGLTPDAFVAGVGTGGTVMGVGRYLRSRKPAIRVHPVEPAESPTLSTGHKVGHHRIQGVSDEFIPPIVQLDELDDVIAVHDGDAILMAQQLAQHGLAVGISSGANLLGALLAQDALSPDAIVVTVFPDSNKKYLSTDLLRTEPVRADYLSPAIEVTGFRASMRVCGLCS
ncbi:MAG TPA: PLP-dependent cysteine synthase family protein [Vicinamibacterales bacterium]|nr:PLP-dependent cysteine synthase family protein [Vicinamibacterales bacterium]